MGIFNSPIFDNVNLLGNALIQQEQFQTHRMTQGMQRDMEYILGKSKGHVSVPGKTYKVKFGKSADPPSFRGVSPSDRVTWHGYPGSAEVKIYQERDALLKKTTISYVKVGDQRFFPEKTMKKEASQPTSLQWLDSRIYTLPLSKVSV